MLRLPASPAGPPLPLNPDAPGAPDRTAAVRLLQRSDFFRNYRQAFEATTGLPLVLRGAGSFRPPLEGSKRTNPFCALMTTTSPTCAACLELQQRVERDAALQAKTRECYAGLSETAVPVRVGTQVLGYLQTGQVFLRRPTRRRFNSIVHLLAGGNRIGDTFGWAEAYFSTPVVEKKHYDMIIRLLAVFAEHLASVSHQLLVGRAPADSPMIARMRQFIVEHHGEPLGLAALARRANMSPSYFCKTFKAATGLTFTSYLARVRVESVKETICLPDRRISEAAFAAGFQSLSQFNRVFRRVTGEAPTAYRDRQHGRNHPDIAAAEMDRVQPPRPLRPDGFPLPAATLYG